MRILILAAVMFLVGNYQAKATTCSGPFGQSPFGAATEQGSGSATNPDGQMTFLSDTMTFLGDNLTFNP